MASILLQNTLQNILQKVCSVISNNFSIVFHEIAPNHSLRFAPSLLSGFNPSPKVYSKSLYGLYMKYSSLKSCITNVLKSCPWMLHVCYNNIFKSSSKKVFNIATEEFFKFEQEGLQWLFPSFFKVLKNYFQNHSNLSTRDRKNLFQEWFPSSQLRFSKTKLKSAQKVILSLLQIIPFKAIGLNVSGMP